MKVECASVPFFYQEVTDLLFEDMLQSTYPLPNSNMLSVTKDINYEDANMWLSMSIAKLLQKFQ